MFSLGLMSPAVTEPGLQGRNYPQSPEPLAAVPWLGRQLCLPWAFLEADPAGWLGWCWQPADRRLFALLSWVLSSKPGSGPYQHVSVCVCLLVRTE